MSELNVDRAMVSLLKEICAARGIQLTAFSDDWVFCLQKDDRVSYVIGYDFSLNSATAKMICKDKAATSDLLGFHGVPRVEHRIFHSPSLAGYVPMKGNWSAMLEYFHACGCDLVCKPNEGTGGRGVIRARTPLELEAAVLQLLSKNRSVCFSPYLKIDAECRVAILHEEAQFAYRKERSALVGDGRRKIRELLLNHLGSAPDFAAESKAMANLLELQLDFERVPAAGERVPLNWRHNLGQGAAPELIDLRYEQYQPLVQLAVRAAQALGVEVASVDVVQTAHGWKVLEINCGIMTESFARAHPEGRRLSRDLYDRIVCAALGLDVLTPT